MQEKVIFNNHSFGKYLLFHIHTVQNAARVPCIVSYCRPFQYAGSSDREKCKTCSVFWVTGHDRAGQESQTDNCGSSVVVSLGGNLLHLPFHLHHVSRWYLPASQPPLSALPRFIFNCLFSFPLVSLVCLTRYSSFGRCSSSANFCTPLNRWIISEQRARELAPGGKWD